MRLGSLLRAVFALLLLTFPLPRGTASAGDLCPEFVGSSATDVAAGDFDEDGFGDLAVVASSPAKIALVFGQAGARPTHFGGALPTGVVMDHIRAGDVNGDGHVDLVTTSSQTSQLRVLLGSGSGTFSYSDPIDAGTAPTRFVLADLNGDSFDDAAVLSGQSINILLADGSGGLATTSTIAFLWVPDDLAAGDIDGDGDRDLVLLTHIPNPQGGLISVYLGIGGGAFATPTISSTAAGLGALDMGDLNEDGRADVAAASGLPGRSSTVLLGQADGSLAQGADFAIPGAALGGRASLADLDGDSHLDLAVIGGPVFIDIFACLGNQLASLRGAGDGTLTSTGPVVQTAGPSLGLATGDVNGDGRADAAVAGGVCGNVAVHLADAAGTLPAMTHPIRAFVDKSNSVIKLNANKSWCVSFEATTPAFDLASETASIELVSYGTGNVSSILRDGTKPLVLGDQDGNLVPDLRVCFTKDQLRQLFGNLQGRQSVTFLVAGTVGTMGCRFAGPLTLDVAPGGNGNNAASFVRPDVDGGGWVLSYRADRPGTAVVRIFDVSGRLVRSLSPVTAGAGWNDVKLSADLGAKSSLRSGVYFYKIDGVGEPMTGRVVVAR